MGVGPKPTQADLAIDLRNKLLETETAITYLRGAGHPVPDEAHEIAGILRRAIAAEELCSEMLGAVVLAKAHLLADTADGERAVSALRAVYHKATGKI